MGVGLPPVQYDFQPNIPVIEKIVTFDEVQKYCTGALILVPGQYFVGCSKVIDGKCYIVRVDDAVVARHERAHCNGWPQSHYGAW
jgi:hypothetical protein